MERHIIVKAKSNLKLVECKCGCQGCYYENDNKGCPYDKCDTETQSFIFIKNEKKNNKLF